MEMTNMQADMILGQLNTIYVSLTKNNEPAPCVLTVGLAKNIRKMQGELKEYFEEKMGCSIYDVLPDIGRTTLLCPPPWKPAGKKDS